MLLRNEALHPFGKQRVGVRDPRIRTGATEEEELLMLEPLARGAVGGPVLLILLELLQPLEDDDQRASASHQPYGCGRRRRHRDRSRDHDLTRLQGLEPTLILLTL